MKKDDPSAPEHRIQTPRNRIAVAVPERRGTGEAPSRIIGGTVPIETASEETVSGVARSGWRRTDRPVETGRRTPTPGRVISAGHTSAAAVRAASLPLPAPPAELPDLVSLDPNQIEAPSGQPDADYEGLIQPDSEIFPVDLPTALRLAGGESWDIQLAQEKVREAYARLDAAEVLWLPSLVAGIGYTKHEGEIQDTRGGVVNVSRNALFAGGGAHTGSSALAGGSGGPARLSVDLSLADAIFEPLVARQAANAEHYRETATYNDTMLSASLAFLELNREQRRLAFARQDLKNARDLVELTEGFVASGKGSRADTALARTEESRRRQMVVQARMSMQIASAELARVLRLNPETTLFLLDDQLLRLEYIEQSTSLSDHVQAGLSQRPEVAEAQSRLDEQGQRVSAEQWRPFLPNVSVATSAGGFGGGVNDELNQLNGRADFDVVAVWQLKNLGFGTQAAIENSESQHRTAHYRLERLLDQVTTEIIQAYHAVEGERERIGLAEASVKEAQESLVQSKARIRGLEGLPLETLQSVQAVAQANAARLDAVIDYNQAQIRLLRATGRWADNEQ